MTARTLPFPGQIMLQDVEFNSPGYEDWGGLDDIPQTQDVNEANAITSATVTGKHKLVIDIDFPMYIVPSSTPGHGHLYIDKEIEWPRLVEILGALADAGIVEEGYAAASIDQGFTTVRAPWTKKSEGEVVAVSVAARKPLEPYALVF